MTTEQRRPEQGATSMSLLVDMMTNTLDPGYVEAAARRASAGESGATGLTVRRLAAMAAAALAGLILVTAGNEASRTAPAAARTHADLVTQVRQRTAAVTELQHQVATLSAQLATLRAAGLGGSASGRSLATTLAGLQVAAGGTAVSGPGVRVTLSDAPAATGAGQASGGQASGGQVLDSDLQHVVNALWASGAEAAAINGQRVTALTSIRAAGDAIVVDFRPVDPPYVVTGIGDPDTLQQRFVSTSAAAALRTYSQAYGLGFAVRGLDSATLPPAAALALYTARAGPTGSPAPTASLPGGTS